MVTEFYVVIIYLCQMPGGGQVTDAFQSGNGLLSSAFYIQENSVCYFGFLFQTFHSRNLKTHRHKNNLKGKHGN